MKEQEFLTDCLRDLKQAVRDDYEAVKTAFGQHPGREPMSLDKQLEAYQQMTAQDMEALTMKHGAAEMDRYFAAMEKALRRRREHASKQAAR